MKLKISLVCSSLFPPWYSGTQAVGKGLLYSLLNIVRKEPDVELEVFTCKPSAKTMGFPISSAISSDLKKYREDILCHENLSIYLVESEENLATSLLKKCLHDVEKYDYRVIHLVTTGNFSFPLLYGLISRFKNTFILKHFYTIKVEYPIIQSFMTNTVYDFAVGSSKYVIDNLFGIPSFKKMVIPPAIDCNLFKEVQHPDIENIIGESNLDIIEDADLKLLYLGQLDEPRFPAKVIFKSIKQARSLGIDISLIIVARDYDWWAQAIKRAVKKIGLQDAIVVTAKFLSEYEKVLLYNFSDFLLHPPSFKWASSIVDPPITVIEALCCGLPVISTPIGSIPQIIKNDLNGYILDFESENLTKVIEEISLKGQRDLEGMRKKARMTGFSFFSIEYVAKELEKVFQGLITKP